mgnify:CR=1 FL=1
MWDSHVNKITINDKIYLKDLPKTQLYFGGVLGFDKVDIVNFAGGYTSKVSQNNIQVLRITEEKNKI